MISSYLPLYTSEPIECVRSAARYQENDTVLEYSIILEQEFHSQFLR